MDDKQENSINDCNCFKSIILLGAAIVVTHPGSQKPSYATVTSN